MNTSMYANMSASMYASIRASIYATTCANLHTCQDGRPQAETLQAFGRLRGVLQTPSTGTERLLQRLE